MKKSKPAPYDPVIISRVKQYLEENVDKTYLDVGVMTKHLQERYAEYSRRKIAPFRALVEQAYHVVSQSYGLDQQSSGDESDASSLEVMDDGNSMNNIMSNMMNSLYHKAKNNTSGTKPTTGEAIDISSDESCDEHQTNSNGKALNPATTVLTKNNPVTVAKTTSNADQPAGKGSSSTVATTDVSNSLCAVTTQPPTMGTRKRHEMSLAGISGQPIKKHLSFNVSNLDKNDNLASHLLQQIQQRQQQPRQYPGNQSQKEQNNGSNADRYINPLSSQRSRKFKKEIQLRKSRETFQDIGGMEKTLKELCELLMHIKSPDIYFVLGLMPPRGILLHGPSGCGKTLLAHAIAGQLNLALIEIPATELVAGISGESEERIRDVFEQAVGCAPCVLFIDEIDAISSNRALATKDMERRIVSQLISSLDALKLSEGGQSVLVIGATTRPDVLDPALRRVGRFDHEIAIGIPTRKDRKDILTIICDGLSVEPKCDFDKIAELTPGYVGADLLALVSRAATIAVKRKCSEQMRAFQLKNQSNITIVDLDDDNEEEKNSEKKTVPAEDEINTNKYNNKTESTVEEMEIDTVEADTNKQLTEGEKCSEGDIEDINKSLDVTTLVDTTNKEKSGESSENVDSEETKGVKNSNGISKEIITAKIKLQEPSLFELLIWLDNPPEDITFVSDFCITLEDFREAVKVVQPLAKREGFVTVPDVSWDDIGSLQEIREELKLAVLAPVKYPEKLARLGLTAPSGVLLCGPPGCGKTLLAKAIANEAGINFISVKGPELMNMYVGESERAVRACFQRARNSAPCVIFFDEFDSLCPKRSDNNETGSGTRVVNQLLTEMDGIEEREGVYILAATNRPDIIDPAVLRPGRLDTILYVGLPEHSDRVDILKATTKNGTRPVMADDVDFDALASFTDGYTGADLSGLVRQASMLALKEALNNTDSKTEDLCVRRSHFLKAIDMLRPSVNAQDRKAYEKLRLKYAAPRLPQINDIVTS
uniref:AAA+ ATPase domain-containing protein n=1 Tax=Glossina brevipalpis TaxID=37001 RepID=A0A1A9WD13_9MUSC